MNSQSPIAYKLHVTKLAKRISLRYDQRGLRIVSPRHISDKQALELITKHLAWIENQQKYFAAPGETLGDGSEVTIFGDKEKIRYELAESASKVSESGEFLVVRAPAGEHSKTLHTWLRKVARKGIIARVQELAQTYNFEYNDVSVRDQTSRWGSCSSKKNLNFSWRLMLAPMQIMDYVIIHELAHTKQMNHSPKFWAIVASCMPDYKQSKKWLKHEGSMLHNY